MPRAFGTCYRLVGARRPLVALIHGVGLEQTMWRPAAASLRREFGVLTYDLLGHGGSHNPVGTRTMADFVAQLQALLEHLKVRRCAVVGFSMGALIAQAYAAQQPSRLTHLALLHSVYRRTAAQCRSVRERYHIARQQGPSAGVEAAIERWFSADYRREQAEVMADIRRIFARHTDDGYLKAYHLFAHVEAQMRRYPAAAITCPALVITGGGDVGSRPAMARALCRALPNAQLIINPGHRHLAPIEHAATLAGQLRDWLRRE